MFNKNKEYHDEILKTTVVDLNIVNEYNRKKGSKNSMWVFNPNYN